jgi:hypothetical protein
MQIPNRMVHTLTGRKRWRRSFFGKLILQVEERRDEFPAHISARDQCPSNCVISHVGWRDARMHDFPEAGLLLPSQQGYQGSVFHSRDPC